MSGTLDQLRQRANEASSATVARNDLIRQARDEGHSLRAVADAAHLSVEAVRRIAAS